MRMKITLRCVFLLCAFLIGNKTFSQNFSPTDLPNLTLWLRADTGLTQATGGVSTWADQSGNNYDAIQITSGNRPDTVSPVELCGKQALHFNGSTDLFLGPLIPAIGNSSVSLFVVAKPSIITGNRSIFSIGGTNGMFLWHTAATLQFRNNGQTVSAGTSSAQYYLFSARKNIGVNDSIFRNGLYAGAQGASYATAFTDTTNYSIGRLASLNNYFNGDIAEIVLYKSALSPAERKNVENYLADKYAARPNLGADTTIAFGFCPIVLSSTGCYAAYLWSTGATTSSVSVNKSGDYWLRTTDIFGRQLFDTIHVTYPSVNINSNDMTICLNDTISIAPQLSSFVNYSFNWSTGETTPSIRITNPADYSVTVFDGTCNAISDTLTLTNDLFATTVSLGADTSMCAGNSIALNSPSFGWDALQFHWSDNSTDSLFAVPATNTYAVTVTNAKGCAGTDDIAITVVGIAPTVMFNGANLCLGETYFPLNTTSGTIISYQWNFGDGGMMDTAAHPVHNYLSSGTYNVSLVAITSAGCAAWATHQVIVKPNPVAVFQTSIACINNSYQFNDLSTAPAGENISSWNWNFGDASFSSTQSPLHTYTNANNYTVTLIVSATNGCVDTIQNSLNVVANYTLPQMPTLIQPADNYQAASQTVNFTWLPSPNAVNYSLLISADSFFTTPIIINNITTTQYTATVSGSQIFYWKVRAYNICNASSESVKRTFTLFTPADLSGLALWLKADTGLSLIGNAVNQWSDQSSNGSSATQNNNTLQPTRVYPAELCGKPALHFDGVDDLLNGVPIPGIGTSSLSLFIVAKPSTVSGNRTIFSIGDVNAFFMWHAGATLQLRNAGQILYGGNSVAQDYYLYAAKKNLGVGDTLYRNGVSVDEAGPTFALPFIDTAKYQLGKLAAVFQNFSGEIAEVILYNTALNPSTQQQVENYLYNKYSTAVNLGADITVSEGFCPVQLNATTCYKNYLWSTNETTPTISVNRSGVYSVSVTDIFGRISIDTVVVTFPNINLTVSDTTLCLGDVVQLQTQLPSITGYTFNWNTGETTSSIQASSNGNYYVQVSYGSCSSFSDTIDLAIDLFENTVSLGADTSMCSGNLIGLKTPASGWNSFQFAWSTGATTSLLTVPATGDYSLTVTNAIGCQGTDLVHVTVTASTPNVFFTGATLCLGADYVPQNTSASTDTSTIIGYAWDFGDGGIDAVSNPTYNYVDTGNYTVTLSVTTSAGCLNSAVQNVLVKPIPTAAFQTTMACINNPYPFINLSTSPAGETINQWDWNFGDASTHATIQNPQHLYNNAANVSITLTVTATNGCSNAVTNNMQVVPSAPLPQIVALQSPSNNFQAVSTTVNFSWMPAQNANTYSLIISTNPSFTSPVIINGISGTQYIATLSNSPVFYWKVKAYNICNDSTESVVNTFTLFVPSFLPNLTLWLKADDGIVLNGNKVEQWLDRSGNNYNAAQIDVTRQPVMASPTQIVKPALSFDGTDDLLNGVPISGIGNNSLSLFIIAKPNTITGNRTIFSIGDANGLLVWNAGAILQFRNAGKILYGPSVVPQDYNLISIKKNIGVSDTLYKNGSFVDAGTALDAASFIDTANYQLGRLASVFQNFNGEIAEVILYNTALNNAAQQQVENYLYNKYSPPVDLGSDITQVYSLCPIAIDAGNRFKDFLWSTGEITPSISVNKTGTYSVTVTDVFERTSTDAINVTMPYTFMSPIDTVICLGQNVNIHPILLSPAAGYSFLWNDSLTTYTVQKDTTGNYSCRITDNGGCSIMTDTTHVRVDSISLLTILPSDTAMCIGNDLAINTGNYPPAQTLWSTAVTTTFITIASSGTYSVSVTDIYGCSTTGTSTVTIKGTAPQGNFTSGIACYGEQTNFTDITIPVLPDSIHQWLWNFGDNGTSLLQNPSHAFPAPGDYSVTMILFTDSGCTGVAVKNISVYAKPIARFSYPGIICAGNSSQLLDVSSVLPPDSVTQWQWRIDQTNLFTTQNVVYNFPLQGYVPVTLIVTTSQGCLDTFVSAVEIFPPLQADFNFTDVCVGDSTKFVDITNSFSVVGWQWSFGDGSFFSPLQNPAHRYLVSGLYPVKLTIENAIGCTDTVAKQILIVQNPMANFTNLSLCEDLNYTPIDSSISLSEPIQFRDWNINGSLFHHINSPQYYFADTGIFAVKLLVTTNSGCQDSIIKTVQVHPNPMSSFAMAPLYGEAPVDVTLTNQSTGASSYDWNFGDGSTHSFAANTLHTYSTNDSFNIVLTVSSDFGCTNSSAQTFYVSHTDLDLSVDVVETTSQTQSDGSVLVGIKILMSNLGTRAITHIQLYATLGTGGLITEDWNGVLPSGQIIQYTFTAQFVSNALRANSFVCVEAKAVNHGETEMRMDNNRQCASLTGTIQLVGPSPNPAFNQSTLGIILPKEGKVVIEIADVVGHLVVPKTELDLPEGRTDFEIPTGLMLPAEYFIRVTYNDEKMVRKFILQK